MNTKLTVPIYPTTASPNTGPNVGGGVGTRPTALIATEKVVTLPNWNPVAPSASSLGVGSGANVHAYALGDNADGTSSGKEYPVGACDVSFWGGEVAFLWQDFGL